MLFYATILREVIVSVGSKNSESSIERIFRRLDRWRHLPAYQLERRADIFFGLFLPEVIEDCLRTQRTTIIPEFPILKEDGFQSHKIDYFAYASNGASFLLELKTDMSSAMSPEGREQKRRLKEATRRGLDELVRGVVSICKRTQAKQKYVHLLYELEQLGLVNGVDNVLKKAFCAKTKRGISEELNKIEFCCEALPKPRAVWIQPEPAPCCDDIQFVSFMDFAAAVDKIKDEDIMVRKSFTTFLRKWAVEKAGSVHPQRYGS